MYTKILVVSFVQVALARHFLDGTFFRTEYNTGHQFRNPGRQNIRVHSVDAYSDGNIRKGYYERYVENYNDAIYQHGSEQANYEIPDNERPQATVNSENAHRRDRYIQGPDSRSATNFEHIPVNHSNQRHHYRTNKQNNNRTHLQKCNQTRYDTQNTLKTNLDTQSTVSDESTEYKRQGTDQSAKTNLNIHSRSDDTQSSIDSLSEVKSNVDNDSMIFIDKDDPKPNGPVKTTDNELRHNASDGIKEDKWVWDATSTTQATTMSSNTTGGDLDDRTSFNGDACPKGQAKILGQCVNKHK